MDGDQPSAASLNSAGGTWDLTTVGQTRGGSRREQIRNNYSYLFMNMKLAHKKNFQNENTLGS